MRPYVVLEKAVGETPLYALSQFTQTHPAYQNMKASYAGRLDPMASGKLLVLFGEECKRQTAYTGLDKEYDVEVLFGVSSDTGDALGLVTPTNQKHVPTEALKKALKKEEGTHEHAYPVFSSKTVGGKPLFLHALSGTLSSISIPTHKEHIYRARLLSTTSISTQTLKERVEQYLARVPKTTEPSKELGADFRIDAVRESWQHILSRQDATWYVARIRVICGSGTYMRTLASRLGTALGTGGIALSIHRRTIGIYRYGIWWKRYV